MTSYLLTLLLLVAIHFTTNAQNQAIVDSLIRVVNSNSADTSKVKALNKLSVQYWYADPEMATNYANDALTLGNHIGFKKEVARSYNSIGVINDIQGNYEEALEYYFKSLAIKEEIDDKRGISGAYNNIGLIHKNQGNHTLALEYYFKSLEIAEQIDNKKGMALAYNNIGIINANQQHHEEALKYYFKSLKLRKEIGDTRGEAGSYNNIGNVYDNQGNYQQALQYYFKGLNLNNEYGYKYGALRASVNIGTVYNRTGEHQLALDKFTSSLQMAEETGDKYGIALSNNNLGITLNYLGKGEEAIGYLQTGLTLSDEIGSTELVRDAAKELSEIYAQHTDYKEAYRHHKLYKQMFDSLDNEANTRKLTELEMQYAFDKQQKETEFETQQTELEHAAAIKRQKLLRNSFFVGFALMVLLAFAFFRNFKIKQKANLVLEEQKKIIEEKNKDITDSIKYAKHIQDALLPNKELMQKVFKEHVIYYQPKDIISGDFYWVEQKGNKLFFALADCTGHGVPGAIMSIIGHSGINKAINEMNLQAPANILNQLNRYVHETLQQDYENSTVRDGMDIAFCTIDLETKKLHFAGANNPVYIIRDNTLHELKGNHFAIGGFWGDELKPYTEKQFDLKEGDMIYTFSDGYPDQFGGPGGKKFKYNQFRDLLLSICTRSSVEQHQQLHQTITNWMGDLEQIDDICVVGVKV